MATILAIDDDANSLTTIAEGLRAAGHQVVTSQQASTASALAAEHRVDAVILEIRMPDLSGYEVLQALRSQPMTGGVPILLLSASSAPAHRIRSLRAGADDFLAKPFATEELMLRLDLLLDQRPRNLGSPPLESPPESAATRPTATGENLMDTPGGEVTLMGRYQVLEVIGQGAMGVVYRGWDPRLRRPVALKTLRFDHPGEQDRKLNISRLLAEAITVARFSDPNIVAVYDVGEGPDSAFIAMELVDGASLDSVLSRQAKLPVDQVIALGIAISRGLAAAHAQGVVHRDVKPGNVLLGRDRSIKVTDFGVALMMSSL
ncbi:MAG: response regulator, partial [Acidobacteriota bacterium]